MRHLSIRYRVFFALLVYFFSHTAPTAQAASDDYYMAFYVGQYTDSTFLEAVTFRNKFWDSQIGVLAIGKKLKTYKNRFRLEVEFQIAEHQGLKYFTDSDPASADPGCCWADGFSHGIQNSGYHSHEEFSFAIIARWLAFPWDHIIDTSIAIGEGISYATREPAVEVDQHYLFHNLEYPISQWLNYLSVEYAFNLPNTLPAWSVFCRVHHRSGIFGLIKNYHGGSDFFTLGLRYDF